ncbi:MAG: hypothetical protein ACP5O2_06480 [Bacteroidales bacterium]
MSWKFLKTVPNKYIYKDLLYYTLDSVFLCRVDSLETIQPADDVEDIVWLDPQKVREREIGLGSIRKIVQEIKSSADFLNQIFSK